MMHRTPQISYTEDGEEELDYTPVYDDVEIDLTAALGRPVPEDEHERAIDSRKHGKFKRTMFPLRLPVHYYEQLKSYSEWSGRSMNATVTDLVGEYLHDMHEQAMGGN